MLNPRLAGRYAKSLLDLAREQNQLDTIYNDVLLLQTACRESREFVALLKSPVVYPDKKQAVLDAISKGRLADLTAGFTRLLIRKGRESLLPEILNAFVQQYKDFNRIQIVKLTTAAPVSEELKQSIVDKVKANTSFTKVDLQSEVDPSIIGGFVLQVGDKLIDASIAYDLNVVKKQFMNNDFIYNIR